MKTFILFTLLLTGCSNMPSSFDSVLYNHIVEISVDTDLAMSSCGTPMMQGAISALNRESKLAVTYSQYTDKDTHDSIMLMDKAITEMNTIYVAGIPSYAYCSSKLGVIGLDADIILTGLGEKSR